MENFLRVKKLRHNVKLPERAHPDDAGIDFFWNPSKNKEYVSIHSGGGYVLETGVAVEIPKGTMLEIKNKSSIASNLQLVVGACVVDHGYSGEVMIDMHNLGLDSQKIEAGQKIAQGVLIPILTPKVEEISHEPYHGNTERGDGGFGSTGSR